MNLSAQSPFASKASQLLSWGHWFTFANIGLALLISSSYLLADTGPTSFLGGLYMVLTWLGHIGFITFICFVLTVFPLSLIFPYHKHIRGMAAVLATIGAAILTFDAYVYFNLGYHISSSALPQIFNLIWYTLSDSPIFVSLLSIGLIALFFCFELIVGNYSWKRLNELKKSKFAYWITVFLVLCFTLSHMIHIWADANLRYDITKQDNVLPLSYPTTAKSLLAKNNLLDLNNYHQVKNQHLTTSNATYQSPVNIPKCDTDPIEKVDILVFNDQDGLKRFLQRTNLNLVETDNFVQPVDHQDSMFNLIYGLPAFYKTPIVSQQIQPSWLNQNLTIELTGFNEYSYIKQTTDPAIRIMHANAQSFDRNNAKHVIAFSLANTKSQIIESSSIYSNDPKLHLDKVISQPMDILATIISQYWKCEELSKSALMGKNLYKNEQDSGINYSQGVFIAYKKDRITMITADGSYKNISAAEGFNIEQKFDVPFIVDNIKKLKQFAVK